MASRVIPPLGLPGFMRDPGFTAPCATADPDLWFPEKGPHNKQVQAICAACPKQAACADWAVTNGERWGVWGGLTERARRTPRPPAQCGTTAGYRRHARTRQPACQPCLAAEAARKQPRRPTRPRTRQETAA